MDFFRGVKSWKWLLPIFVILALILYLFAGDPFGTQRVEQKDKIGFVILGDVREPGWNASHYQGIRTAAAEYGMELLVRDKVTEKSGQCWDAVQELAEEGCGLIYLCSYNYAPEVKDLINAHKKINFVTYSETIRLRNLTSCFVRMYQGFYMAGALAGLKTRTNCIGYVAAMPNAAVMRGINAFVLGAQRVNKNVKVVVAWTGAWAEPYKEKVNVQRLVKEADADVISYYQDDHAVAEAAEKMGIDFIGYNTKLEGYSEHHLTDVCCHWDMFYRNILQRYLKGGLRDQQEFFMGIENGVVELGPFSKAVPEDIKAKLNIIKEGLKPDYLIFSGTIYDTEGNLRCGERESLSEEALFREMKWLVRGVEVLPQSVPEAPVSVPVN
jgi:basic membrane protein A